jgi:hypothetical protein
MSWTPARLAVPIVLTLAACNPDTPSASKDITAPVFAKGVSASNQAVIDAINAANAQAFSVAPNLVPPAAPLAPFVESRLYAIENIAIHDALNAIVPRFERYADNGAIDGDANPAVAVLKAAHDAIAGADPGGAAATDAWYAAQIAPLTSADGYAEGVAIGTRVAAAILALRASDGTAGGGVAPYTPGLNPGDYQFTAPFNAPPFDVFGTGGFADASEWGNVVTPFALTSGSQFRAAPPYNAVSNSAAVLTKQYTKDFNEVKALGCAGCTARSAEQTEIALFWAENGGTGWFRIAQTLAAQKKLDAWETARLYALLEIGVFDSYIASLETKYYYDFWRPVSAVALAGGDGNPDTSPAGGWEVLLFPTPPVPDYPSAHAETGATAGAIIEKIIPGKEKKFSATSTSLPGPTRNFKNVDDAVDENGLSRIYIGYHFREAVNEGIKQGRKMGDFIATSTLRKLK